MRPAFPLCLLSAFVAAVHLSSTMTGAAELAPYGIADRVLWNDSRVVGSPDPPLPYRVRKLFPKLKLFQPIFVRAEPGTNQLFAVQHLGHWQGPGKLVRFENQPEVEKEEVLLELNRLIYGLTFHPQYEQNGYVYLVTNGPSAEKVKQNRISRFTVDRQPPHRLAKDSELLLLEWESNGHNGGDLGFGPDGYLYIPTGDGTSDSDENMTGQDLVDLCAVMIRIDVDHPTGDKPYSIPPDNPFINVAGARPEIWAYGFRNPWRMHYDWPSDQLWVGQNGQDLWEQVLLVKRGENYGWSVTEGGYPFNLQRKPGPTPISKPIVDHAHSEFRSLSGGVVYRGAKLPALEGVFVYGDFSTGRIWGVKHDGQKITFLKELADTPLQVVGFAVDQRGELLVVDQGTGFYAIEPAPQEEPKAPFPTRLSETGLFTSLKPYRPHAALVPYSVNSPLWSDGTTKERHIALVGDSQIEPQGNRGWQFPENAVLVKTFALELEAGNAATSRRIETRLLTKQQGEWQGYSYRWNDEQTDAEMVAAAGADQPFDIREAGSKISRTQVWHYPSRTECMVCHSRAANFVLGLTTMQMNRPHDYGHVRDHQLRTLEHLGMFRVPLAEHDQALASRYRSVVSALYGKPQAHVLDAAGANGKLAKRFFAKLWQMWDAVEPLRPSHPRTLWKEYFKTRALVQKSLKAKPRYVPWLARLPIELPRLVDPYDSGQELNARARSYLHANCSICHVPAGGGNALVILEAKVADDKLNLFDQRPQHHSFGLEDARIIATGSPQRSTLLHRVKLRGTGQMPPLATLRVDEPAVEMLSRWIESLKKVESSE